MRTMMLILGMALLVLAVQGAIRLLVDHENAGLLSWMPGGLVAQLACYVVAAAAGITLASRHAPRSRKTNGKP